MSSTSNIQNLLVNVFRPVYTYSNGTYTPKLNISNVDTVSARTLEVTTFGFGDSNGNIYIGSNSGGTSNNSANVAIGVSAATNAISTSNSVFIGYGAGLGASNSANNIVVGYNASGAGNNNIYIGSNDGGGTSSSNNIYIGNGLSNTGSVTNKFQLGFPGSILMTGDFSNKQLGVNTIPSYTLDVCGDLRVTERYGIFTLDHDASLNLTSKFQCTNPGSKALLSVVGDISATGDIFGTVKGTLATSSIGLGNGTAAAPSHGFSNAAGYGMFYTNSFGPNRVGLAAFSNEVVSITGGGYVGIGTSTPNSTLDISGNITATTIGAQLFDSSRIVVSNYIRNNTSGSLWDISDGNMKLSNNLNVKTITVSGDVSSSGTFYGNYVATSITSSNLVVPGYIRNDISASLWDISGGSMKLTQRLDGSGITVSNYIRNNLNATQWDISGGNMKLTQTLDTSSITYSGKITGSTVSSSNNIGGIILSNYRYQGGNPFTTNIYANIDLGGGYCNAGGSAARSYPAIAFGYGDSGTGGYRHFIRSRHDTLSNNGNAIDFFTNIGANQEDSSGPYISNVLAMSVTAAGVEATKLTLSNIGSGNWLTLCNGSLNYGNIYTDGNYGYASFTGGVITGFLRDRDVSSNFDISGGNMRLTQRLDVSSITVSNYIRNALTPTLWDISGGMKLTQRLDGSGITFNTYIRNALTPTTFDLSSGNMFLSSKLGIGNGASNSYNLDILANANPGVIVRHSTDAAAIRLLGGATPDTGTSGMVLYHNSNEQGILTSNANPFNIYTNNLQRMTILSNGNVGIGTTPSYLLDVNGTTKTTNILSSGYLRDSLIASNFDISGGNIRAFSNMITGAGTVSAPSHTFSTDKTSGMYAPSTLQLAFTTGGIQRMCISGIYSGIGTTAPVYALDISSGLNPAIGIRNNIDAAAIKFMGGGSADSVGMAMYHTPTEQGIVTSNTNPFHFYMGGSAQSNKKFTILSNGYVGIGFSNPSAPLDISGSLRLLKNDASGGLTGSGGQSKNHLVLQTSITDVSGITSISFENSTYVMAKILSQDTRSNIADAFRGDLIFQTFLSTQLNERMRITNSGNVGIGVSAPSYQLHLSTDSAFKLTTSTWTTTSDKRVKQNIVNADTSMCYNIVKNLPLKRFTWDASYMPNVDDRNSVGWIAQEVKNVFPNAVKIMSNQYFDDFHSLDVDQIYKSMYGAISKLIADKESLEAKVDSLIARINALENA